MEAFLPTIMRTRSLAAFGLLLALAACGSDNPSTPPSTVPPTTTTTQPAAAVLVQDTAQVPKGQFYTVDVTTTRAGRIDVTVDWQFSNSAIDVFLSNSRCSRTDYENDACTFLTKSLSFEDHSKPRTLTASGVAAGTYTLVIENGGPNEETLPYRVSLTPASAASGSLSLGPRSLGPRR